MDIISSTEEMVPIYINPKTDSGKSVGLDGPAVLSVPTGGATTRPATQQEIDDDAAAGFPGLVGFVKSEDTPGQSSWLCKGDADLGAGVVEIFVGGTYTYNHPMATNLGATAGSPRAKS